MCQNLLDQVLFGSPAYITLKVCVSLRYDIMLGTISKRKKGCHTVINIYV